MTENAPVVPPEVLAAAAELDPPFGVLHAESLWANADAMVARAGGTPIRVATKSIRVPEVITRLLGRPGFAGLMCYTLPEALWWFDRGFTDVLVAYPTVHRAALRRLMGDPVAAAAITITVDSTEHLDLLDRLAPPGRAQVKLCVELDVGYLAAGGLLRVGTLRSPLRSPRQVLGLVREIGRRPGFVLDGMLAYEGQIAGMGDAGRGPRSAVLRRLQALSVRELARRRAAVVKAVRDETELRFVNGGGTGSVESTSAESAVTEIGAGSGILGPALFDGYRHFRPLPAAWFVLPVVRRPGRRVATALGGGWIASGPTGADRSPVVAHPAGLAFRGTEGAGEVQTPLLGRAARRLRVGDQVWLRHAKAGELAEHLNGFSVVAGGLLSETWPTYRGLGQDFL